MPEQIHVLVVDDEPAISRAVGIALSRAGYRVTTALSGESALATVRAEPVDVLVVDLRLRDMRGDALFEYAAAIQPHLRTHTLFTTGDISERAEQIIEACGCAFLRKPFDLKDVIQSVASMTRSLGHRNGVA